MITRIALYTVLGLVLDSVGVPFNTWGFWCVVGLYWAVEAMARQELIEQLTREVQALKNKGKSND